jgi:hypothetical protein
VVRAAGWFVLALTFSGVLATCFVLFTGPLWFFGGYDGLILAMALSLIIFLAGTVYFTRALCRSHGLAQQGTASQDAGDCRRDP